MKKKYGGLLLTIGLVLEACFFLIVVFMDKTVKHDALVYAMMLCMMGGGVFTLWGLFRLLWEAPRKAHEEKSLGFLEPKPREYVKKPEKTGLISTVKTSQGYTKYYRCTKVTKPIPFLKHLQARGLGMEKVMMKRDAEMDMQFGIGEYSMEELVDAEKALDYGPVCVYTLKTRIQDTPVEIRFSDVSRVVYLNTPDKKLDIPGIEEW